MADEILPGNGYRLYRMTTGAPQFVCMATTLSHTESKTLDTALVNNCDNPEEPATTVSAETGRGWTVNGSGAAIMKHYAEMRADYKNRSPVPYRIVAQTESGEGSGQWEGDLRITNMQFQKQNEGIVQFSFQMQGEGDLDFVTT